MQAIVTKYHGPTNVRGSRVSATCAAGRIIVDWDDALNHDDNHKVAAQMLCQKLKWDRQFVSGTTKDGDGVHVFID